MEINAIANMLLANKFSQQIAIMENDKLRDRKWALKQSIGGRSMRLPSVSALTAISSHSLLIGSAEH